MQLAKIPYCDVSSVEGFPSPSQTVTSGYSNRDSALEITFVFQWLPRNRSIPLGSTIPPLTRRNAKRRGNLRFCFASCYTLLIQRGIAVRARPPDSPTEREPPPSQARDRVLSPCSHPLTQTQIGKGQQDQPTRDPDPHQLSHGNLLRPGRKPWIGVKAREGLRSAGVNSA